MKKQKYEINVYKLNDLFESRALLEVFSENLMAQPDRDIAFQTIQEGIERYEIVYFAYRINSGSKEIKWYEKWKDFVELDKELRTNHTTGHGLICIQDNELGYAYAITFGRSFPLIKDLVTTNFGIEMGRRLFDGKSADAISSKYYSMVRNKSLVDYYEGSSMFIDDTQAVELIASQIAEEYSHSHPHHIKELLSIISSRATINYSRIKMVISKESIGIADVINVLYLLHRIEHEYDPRFDIPYLKPIPLILSEEIDTYFLLQMKKSEIHRCTISIPFYFKNEAEEFVFFSGIDQFSLSCDGHIEPFETIDHDDIVRFLERWDVSNIRDVWLTAISSASTERLELLKWLDVYVEYKNQAYVLYSGKWCIFNDAYLNRLNKKVEEIEAKHVTHMDQYSVSKDEIQEYIVRHRAELIIASGSDKPEALYREFVYNYILSRKVKWALFDRKVYKDNIEICDLAIEDQAHIHVKIGDSGKLEEALRQSINGIRFFEREKSSIIDEVVSYDNKKMTVPNTIAILFLNENKGSGLPSNSKSIRLKQTFVDWAEEVEHTGKNYWLMIANFTTKSLHPKPLFDRLDECELP